MKVTVQVVLQDDDESSPTVVREVFSLQRGVLTPDTLGLHLAEAKDLLGAVQQTLVEAQAQAAVTAAVPCPHCARPRGTRTPAASSCAPCSARCGCPAHVGGTALAGRGRPVRSARWPPYCPSAAPRNWSTCRPSSPG